MSYYLLIYFQVLFLNLFSQIQINSVRLLRHLQPLAFILCKISKLLPELFTSGNGLDSLQKQEDTTLREWELESDHDYENNMHFTKVNLPHCFRRFYTHNLLSLNLCRHVYFNKQKICSALFPRFYDFVL